MIDPGPKVLLFPNIEKDGIGTYIRGLAGHFPVSRLAYAGNIMGPGQFFARLPRGYDILHVPHFLVPCFTGRMKVVCTIQDITPMLDPAVPGPHRVYLRLRIAWSLRRASHVIFTSEATYQETVKEFGPVERHSIIPLACDDPVPEGRIGANPYPFPYFFHVGRRRAHKNVGAIIRALACQHARGAHLVLGGREDIGDRTLIALAAEIGVANRLHFSGFLTAEQLATHYRHAEALVFPSLMEGFGIPILESMSYGCPVITSARSSMPEVAGNAALLVEPSDPECIAFAMGRVLSEPGLRSALREKGFSNGKRFSWKFTSEETARIYHGLWNRVPQEVAS